MSEIHSNFGPSHLMSGWDDMLNRTKKAQTICLELKHQTTLMLHGQISEEQFRSQQLKLIKAFKNVRLTNDSDQKG